MITVGLSVLNINYNALPLESQQDTPFPTTYYATVLVLLACHLYQWENLNDAGEKE